MSPGNRIPIPIRHRLRRFRYGAMPGVCFLVCLGFVMWLWHRQGQMPNAVGEVERLSRAVKAGASGTLLRVNPPGDEQFLASLVDRSLELAEWEEQYGPDWQRWDAVNEGQIIARLDHRAAEADLKTVDYAVKRLREDLLRATEQLRLDNLDRRLAQQNLKIGRYRQLVQLTTDIERYRLDILDREAAIAKANMAWKRFVRHEKLIEDAHKDKAISSVEYYQVLDQRDGIIAGIAEDQKALDKVQEYFQRADGELQTFLADYPETQLPTADAEAALAPTLLAPLRTAIIEQQVQIEKLRVQIDSLVIRAPISGQIHEVFYGPGQQVQAGDEILTIVSEKSQYIVSYVPEERSFRPGMNVAVDVKRRIPGSRPVVATILDVGPQVELIPQHQRRDPLRPEWGLPVKISLPDPGLFPVLPGEKVDVRFKAWTAKEAG